MGNGETDAPQKQQPESLCASHEVLQSFVEDVTSLWSPSSSSHVPVLDGPPTSLEFLRDYVSLNRPCVIRNAARRKNDPLRLTLDDICRRFEQHQQGMESMEGDALHQITVDVTPDGHGDCIRTMVKHGDDPSLSPDHHAKCEQKVFVKPHERHMSVLEFRDRLRQNDVARDDQAEAELKHQSTEVKLDGNDRAFLNQLPSTQEQSIATTPAALPASDLPQSSTVYYSRQNDCLRNEFAFLLQDDVDGCDIPQTVPWGEEAFGTGPPDAINLWIGNQHSTSSMHKDHYENLFYVASGEKIFTICPPASVPFLYEHLQYDSATFVPAGNSWFVQLDQDDGSAGAVGHDPPCSTRVQWIEPDVEQLLDTSPLLHSQRRRLLREFPLLQHVHPIQIRVQAGEMLYLPALWFHKVTQSCETVGINFWYDMKFDSPNWCYFHLLQQMRPCVVGSSPIEDNERAHIISNGQVNADAPPREEHINTATAATTDDDDRDGENDEGDEIIQLPVLKYGYRTIRYTWADLKHIIEVERNVFRLSRSEEQQIVYERSKREMKRNWFSIYDLILHSKFGFKREIIACESKEEDNAGDKTGARAHATARPATRMVWKVTPSLSECKVAKTALVVNDFPYYTERNIVHFVLWKIGEDITAKDIEEARLQLLERAEVVDILYWENPRELRSLPGIEHIHFLCLTDGDK